ncbi:hypothetical protein J3Q64DRAFT_1822840 [Phycomyces blakesleeanus]|uniref:F-box domain-containing protein n=2 Tax=Phycomyces blakesleeanus TaxID=4837 RepID=A0A162NFZ7_PHYB8|nr:hypothetical protein PHYBLDRAFT_145375 [Phycomyces blakesleeanus NRRL 1555(-)]OAD73908.1 hypothetical protein PHYBLDRAFT_145375 [Phycomyces blakesleeanus NRRL 1555(-)]|eukprot:XP_018291948.1 hypothetical protein PHYBLDRAFT_145375 [Phycomyces blakesleeanus NRRL 1555(-)]
MDRIPLEILFKILGHVPLNEFSILYKIFPAPVLAQVLVMKLRREGPPLDLVSTNLHELHAPHSPTPTHKKNESLLALYFATFDPARSLLWFLPNFQSSNYYFKVKNSYVSHGKLVVRPHGRAAQREHCLGLLGDIGKHVPPPRAGTFSGATETSMLAKTVQEITLHRGDCLVDACLMVGSNHISQPLPLPKQAMLSTNYTRQPLSPSSLSSSQSVNLMPDPTTCGYFIVERVALTLPAFLALYET